MQRIMITNVVLFNPAGLLAATPQGQHAEHSRPPALIIMLIIILIILEIVVIITIIQVTLTLIIISPPTPASRRLEVLVVPAFGEDYAKTALPAVAGRPNHKPTKQQINKWVK